MLHNSKGHRQLKISKWEQEVIYSLLERKMVLITLEKINPIFLSSRKCSSNYDTLTIAITFGELLWYREQIVQFTGYVAYSVEIELFLVDLGHFIPQTLFQFDTVSSSLHILRHMLRFHRPSQCYFHISHIKYLREELTPSGCFQI